MGENGRTQASAPLGEPEQPHVGAAAAPLPDTPGCQDAREAVEDPPAASEHADGVQVVADTRVVIVDDQPLSREGLRLALESAAEVQVVAEAETVSAALNAIAAQRPDVVVMDLSLPDAPRVAEVHPDLPVLVLTASDDDATLMSALQAGAHGYVVKGSSRDEVLRAVCIAADAGAVWSRGFAARVSGLLAGGRRRDTGQSFPGFTAREVEVLEMFARGLDKRAIAVELCLSEPIIKYHLRSISRKLLDSTEAETIARLRELGLRSYDAGRAQQAD
ncbi:response regulator transcription factor [Streptomyces klenkii]|uniref:response regulator transcription factor n=1 Tax=Streptomyces klenkii TaxID=1420899 RepID=UPI0034385FBF